jgi:hypothetical protein
MSSQMVDALCRLPIVFKDRGDISMVELLRESGYNAIRCGISEHDIEAHLRMNPDLIQTWVAFSEDQRCSPARYLAKPGAGLDGKEGWRVGHYTASPRLPERLFPDEYEACAFFIMRSVQELSTVAG